MLVRRAIGTATVKTPISPNGKPGSHFVMTNSSRDAMHEYKTIISVKKVLVTNTLCRTSTNAYR